MGPMLKGFGMRRCGVDQLHLVYLNVFKHLFKYTIHEPLPDSKKKVVSAYLKAAGFVRFYRGVAGDVTYFLVEHLLLQRGRMASAALSDF